MFQIKSKIFAASVLGVSILLIGSLVSFTIYLVAKSNTAHDGTSVGYIFGGSYDESYKMSQQLLKDKVVQHAFVLPTFLHNQNEPPSKIASVSTAHLLLVQTSAGLIPHVKDAIKKASNNSYPQKVWTAIFSAAAEATPFLSFALPTAPRNQAATKDLLISDSVRLSPDNADRQNGSIFRKLAAAITLRSLNDGELYEWTGIKEVLITSMANGASNWTLKVQLGTPFLIKMKGTPKAGYIWMLGPLTSAFLEIECADKLADGFPLDDALLYIKATAKELGNQSIELNYVDPAGSEPPMSHIITVDVVLTSLVQL